MDEAKRKVFVFVCRTVVTVSADNEEEARLLMKPRGRPGPQNVHPPEFGYESGGARVDRISYEIESVREAT